MGPCSVRRKSPPIADKELHTEQAIAPKSSVMSFAMLVLFLKRAHVEMALFANLEIAVDLPVFNHGAINGFRVFLADGQKRYLIIKIDKLLDNDFRAVSRMFSTA